MRYTKIIGIEDIMISLLEVKKAILKCMISGLAFLVIGILLTLNSGVDNNYSASAMLYCPTGNYTESTGTAQLLTNYSSLIKSQKVAERAVSLLGNTSLTYKNIQQMVTYTLSPTGVNLTINASSSNTEEAVNVANAVANAFIEEMRTITNSDSVQILTVAEKASLLSNGVKDLWKKRAVFFALGFILMAGIVFAKELFSDKIRSVGQCLLTDEDMVLGIIPEIEEINER